jgi:hypothetical protein
MEGRGMEGRGMEGRGILPITLLLRKTGYRSTAFRAPHSAFRTPHSALRTPRCLEKKDAGINSGLFVQPDK